MVSVGYGVILMELFHSQIKTQGDLRIEGMSGASCDNDKSNTITCHIDTIFPTNHKVTNYSWERTLNDIHRKFQMCHIQVTPLKLEYCNGNQT